MRRIPLWVLKLNHPGNLDLLNTTIWRSITGTGYLTKKAFNSFFLKNEKMLLLFDICSSIQTTFSFYVKVVLIYLDQSVGNVIDLTRSSYEFLYMGNGIMYDINNQIYRPILEILNEISLTTQGISIGCEISYVPEKCERRRLRNQLRVSGAFNKTMSYLWSQICYNYDHDIKTYSEHLSYVKNRLLE